MVLSQAHVEDFAPPHIAVAGGRLVCAGCDAVCRAPLLARLPSRLQAEQWTLAPVAIVRLGRVAVADEVAECLGARLVLLLIGERPGLSSPDSMGLYATWAPRVGLT